MDWPGRPRWARLLPVLAIALAVATATLVARAPWSSTGGTPAVGEASADASTPADAVRVSSDAPRHAGLDELVASADQVVRGRVVATERGRWFGEGATSARVQSRLVTLQVDEVLAGGFDDETLVIEEEGWLADGAPLIVDGAAASRVDDAGIWFLAEGGDPVLGAYVVLGAEGRYLVAGSAGTLAGADLDDPLIEELTELTEAELTDRIRSAG